MDLNHKYIFKMMGTLMIFIGISMFPSILMALLYKEPPALKAFAATAVFSIIIGIFLAKMIRAGQKRLKVRDGYLIVASCWLLASVIGSVPYMLSGEIPNFIDAFFETTSGFSTTGASILTDVENVSRSVLFWRAFTQWLGGMGILVFAVAILPSLGIGGNVIVKAEAPGPMLEKVAPKISDSAKILYIMYTSFTLLEIVLLLICGMNFYDSLVHTFASISTGGFSAYNDSIAHFDSVYIDTIVLIFMFIGGISFNLYYLVIRHGFCEFLHDSELKLYTLILVVSALLIGINLHLSGIFSSASGALRHSAFQAVSIMTTTGFVTDNYDLWPTFSKMILLALMLIGGCSASAAGGIKVIRILMIYKLIGRGIYLRLHPKAVVSIRIRDKAIPADIVSKVASFVFLYVAIIFVSSILISLDSLDMMSGISAVISCIGNIGSGFGASGPMIHYSTFSYASKGLLSVLMLIGRLELFTLLMLFVPGFWNPNR